MRLLPTPAKLREERRRALDNENRIAHLFFTRDRPGELVQWDYVRGSGSSGIRRYRSTEGAEKRLRSYNNRYRETEAAGNAHDEEEEDVSEDEDGGFFCENENVETEGCYAPVEKDAAKLKELVGMSHSYLENDDGSGELKILAVGCDIVAALQRAVDRCAHTAARPSIFSRDLDVAFVISLQLCQLVNASWRTSLADEDKGVRSGAAVITRLPASILGPLYQEIKPLDPETKDAKVLTLYLHAPIADLHRQVGSNRGAVAFVSDDLIEGHVRGIGRYTHNHGNSASQAALTSDLAGLCDGTVRFFTPRSHPVSLIFTTYIHVCKCWKTLGVLGLDDFAALATIAEASPEVSVEYRFGGEEMLFTLPLHERVDANKTKRVDARGGPQTGKKEALRRGLRRSQGVIRVCICGRLTGRQRSQVTELARIREGASRLRFELEKQATSSRDGPSGVTLGGPSGGPSGSAAADGGAVTGGGAPAEVDNESASEADDVASPVESGGDYLDAEKDTMYKAKAGTMSSVIKRHVPPSWLLRRGILSPIARAAVMSDADDEPNDPPLAVVDAALREHIVYLQCLLMRTKSREYGQWTVGAKVQPSDMIEAAQTVRERPLAARAEIFPLHDDTVLMEA